MITTLSSVETIERLSRMMDGSDRVYYLRFGGDFAVMDGGHDGYQPWSLSLQHELEAAFRVEHEEFIRSVPLCYPTEPGMERVGLATVTPPTWAPYVAMLGRIESMTPVREFWNANAMSYLAACRPEVLRAFLDRHVVPATKMLVGGTDSRELEPLLGPIRYGVKVPAYAAYDEIDGWWPAVRDVAATGSIDTFLLAAGVSSRVVGLRLWGMGVRAHVIDLGSWIDAYLGRDVRTWIRRARESGVDFSLCGGRDGPREDT